MGGTGRTVLVVDDEPSIRLLCRVNLELEGFRVLEAGTLDEARDRLDAEPVDVVLLDVRLGADSGWALVDELSERGERIGVALLTGSVEVEPEMRARVDDVIRKPFTLEELISTVRRLLAVRSETR